jgi:hypothetical protein
MKLCKACNRTLPNREFPKDRKTCTPCQIKRWKYYSQTHQGNRWIGKRRTKVRDALIQYGELSAIKRAVSAAEQRRKLKRRRDVTLVWHEPVGIDATDEWDYHPNGSPFYHHHAATIEQL